MFWVFVLLFVGLLALYKFFLGYSKDSRKVCVGDQSSSTAVTLLKGLLRGLVKRSGVLQGQVSEVRLQLSPVLSQTEVESYERATVFSGGRAEKNKTQVATALSVCFPQVLSVRPSAGLIVSQGFPMSPLGIVHIQQTITQHKVLPVTGNYALEVFFARYPSGLMYAETDKGIELTIRVTLADRKSKELFWEGDTVVLSRAKAPGKRSGPAPVFESPVWDQQAQVIWNKYSLNISHVFFFQSLLCTEILVVVTLLHLEITIRIIYFGGVLCPWDFLGRLPTECGLFLLHCMNLKHMAQSKQTSTLAVCRAILRNLC